MGHLLLLGNGKGLVEVAALLHSAAHMVTLAPSLAELQRSQGPRFDLMVAEMDDGAETAAVAETAKQLAMPWLSCPARRRHR